MSISQELRKLVLEAVHVHRIEKIQSDLRDLQQEVIKISREQRRIYATNASTGGMPPTECRAPISKSALASRLAKKRRERQRRSTIDYSKYASTGFRPPSECRAPARPFYPEEDVADWRTSSEDVINTWLNSSDSDDDCNDDCNDNHNNNDDRDNDDVNASPYRSPKKRRYD